MAGSVRSRVRQAAAHDEPVGQDSLLPDLGAELEAHQFVYEIQRLQGELKRAQSLHELREEFSRKIYGLVRWWLIGVFGAVMLAGFKYREFALSDAVVIAFITSTTLNVIGLFVLVAKWLFPSPNGPDKTVSKPQAEARSIAKSAKKIG